MVITENTQGALCLRLLPNRSATWLQTMYVVASVAVFSMAIAIFWAVQGAWVILPFTGLELLLLAYVAHRVSSETYYQQVVIITNEKLEVQWGKNFPTRRWVFEREKTCLEIVNPHHSLSPPQLLIKAGEAVLPIGERLNKEDIDRVIDQFKAAQVPVTRSGQIVVNAIDGFDL